ncbi:hypothetical protein RQ734_03180 [Roseomonas mucosa]|uniref:hypothetical protein n=1 Tax=Roseomonas mucosa TaxID=207340 RepID=UPI0028CCF920|nr:hypothetical protein [Roseomonas mucosa]MDT8265823.1 hypothetical protein [Roseomonas sp. DSM 102946]MDT8275047.1 hypothetical protein [Roseomonas mucosa]
MLEDWKRQLHLWRRQVVRPGTQQNMQALLVTQAGARTALGMIVVALTVLAVRLMEDACRHFGLDILDTTRTFVLLAPFP